MGTNGKSENEGDHRMPGAGRFGPTGRGLPQRMQIIQQFPLIIHLQTDKIKIKRHQSTSFQSINRNFINNDIPKIVSKNYRLSKKIQKELEGVIDNSHCVYCLKRVTQPITLSCGHELCLSCAEEIISLYKFTHIPTIEHSFIKCPKCKTKSNIFKEVNKVD